MHLQLLNFVLHKQCLISQESVKNATLNVIAEILLPYQITDHGIHKYYS